LTPAEERRLIDDIELIKAKAIRLAFEHGRDPVDALMMLLVAAAQIYREFAIDPNSMGEIHEALDKAMEAATSWFVPENLQ
jgi:hypothetical protein